MMGMFDHRVCACTCEYSGHVIGSGRSMSSERLFFAHLAKTLAFFEATSVLIHFTIWPPFMAFIH